VKAISNYVAAVLTISMIFLSVSFYISSMLKQVELSNLALNTMVKITDRAREDLAISYSIYENNTLVLSIINKGTIEVYPSYLVVYDKNMSVYTISVNYTRVPIGGVINLYVKLPCSFDRVYSIKLTTTRGNVYDVLSTSSKPLLVVIIPGTEKVVANESFTFMIVIRNDLIKPIILTPDSFDISFIDHVTGSNLTDKFKLESISPDVAVMLNQNEQIIYRFTYQYTGGLQNGTSIDLLVKITSYTVNYEEIYIWVTSKYLITIG